jgi:hypothetical protein
MTMLLGLLLLILIILPTNWSCFSGTTIVTKWSFATKYLFPQGLQVDGKTKTQSNSLPFNIKELP